MVNGWVESVKEWGSRGVIEEMKVEARVRVRFWSCREEGDQNAAFCR